MLRVRINATPVSSPAQLITRGLVHERGFEGLHLQWR
jgi:hypothetical protein